MYGYGGHLATLDTLDEMYWMKGFRGYHSTLHGAAKIGGRRMNGVWKWVADKPGAQPTKISHFDWSKNQPDKSGDCLQLFGTRIEKFSEAWFKFDDMECDAARYYICEKNVH